MEISNKYISTETFQKITQKITEKITQLHRSLPIKLQKDKLYTMNDQEKNIYNKLALEKLKAEMKMLTTRREPFRNCIDTIDKQIKQFLDSKSIPEILRREVLSEWEKECQTDISRLQDIWKKKIEGTKKTFEKDKALTRRKANSNEKKKTNKENNISNMKENSSNLNEERINTPNPSRHNSCYYNHYQSQNQSNRYKQKNYYHKYHLTRQRQHLRFKSLIL